MNELLIKIQDICFATAPGSLLITGAVAVALGMFLWLGGIRYRGIVLGLLGGALGVAVGGLIGQWIGVQPLAGMAIGALIFALLAVVMQNVIIVILAAIIFACVGGTGYLSYLMDNPEVKAKLQQVTQKIVPGAGDKDDNILQEALTQRIQHGLEKYLPAKNEENQPSPAPASKFSAKLHQIWSELQPYIAANKGTLLIWCIGGAVVGFILAHILKKIIMALCCSLVGAAATILGVLMLIIAKGTPAIASLNERPRVLPMIFLAMVVFGWLVQMMLKPRTRAADHDDHEHHDHGEHHDH